VGQGNFAENVVAEEGEPVEAGTQPAQAGFVAVRPFSRGFSRQAPSPAQHPGRDD
jgi:hypothetical protein